VAAGEGCSGRHRRSALLSLVEERRDAMTHVEACDATMLRAVAVEEM
jgi:hypothetical protein